MKSALQRVRKSLRRKPKQPSNPNPTRTPTQTLGGEFWLNWYARPHCLAETLTFSPESQAQSPFFTTLPLEVRGLIYEYAMHKEVENITLLYVNVEPETRWTIKCESIKKYRPPYVSLWTFPFTCKLAYVESIKYMYTQNTFRINNRILSPLADILAPHFYHSIRSISLDHRDQLNQVYFPFGTVQSSSAGVWSLGCRDEMWNYDWQILSRMRGLRHLDVTLNTYGIAITLLDAYKGWVLYECMDMGMYQKWHYVFKGMHEGSNLRLDVTVFSNNELVCLL